jgi:hypothetical protein
VAETSILLPFDPMVSKEKEDEDEDSPDAEIAEVEVADAVSVAVAIGWFTTSADVVNTWLTFKPETHNTDWLSQDFVYSFREQRMKL